jgi:hypothetical protein
MKVGKAVGTGTVLTIATSAGAVIVVNNAGFTVQDADPFSQFESWDIDGVGGQGDFFFYAFNSTMSIWTDATGGSPVGFVTNAGSSSLVNLNEGYVIDSNRAFYGYIPGLFQSENILRASGFTSGENGYVGFRFTPSGTTLYGWAEVRLTEGENPRFDVFRWAYEDSGNAISVGAVPEPAETAGGLGLLALGAAGLRHWRRKRQATAAS